MDPGIAVVLERRQTADGELVLRRAGGHLELIMNGVFLMSTSNGASERELVRAARPRGRLLIGGLGAGFSLAVSTFNDSPSNDRNIEQGARCARVP